MEVNLSKNTKSLIVFMSIIFLVYTMVFLVVQITGRSIIANIFVVLCFLIYWCKGTSAINNYEKYPWAASNSVLVQRYFTAEQVFLLIAVHIYPNDLSVKSLVGFLLINSLIFSAFVIFGITKNTAASTLWLQQEKAKQTIFVLKTLVSDMETLAEKSPDVTPVLEALKSADPLINISLEEFDIRIKDDSEALKHAVDAGDNAMVNELCITLQDAIRNRNNRAILLKNYKE